MGGGDGKFHPGTDKNYRGCRNVSGNSAGRGYLGNLCSHSGHNAVTIGGKADYNTCTSKGKDPEGYAYLHGHTACLGDIYNGCKGPYGIGNVICAVGKGN